jgi:hypothetical protein
VELLPSQEWGLALVREAADALLGAARAAGASVLVLSREGASGAPGDAPDEEEDEEEDDDGDEGEEEAEVRRKPCSRGGRREGAWPVRRGHATSTATLRRGAGPARARPRHGRPARRQPAARAPARSRPPRPPPRAWSTTCRATCCARAARWARR